MKENGQKLEEWGYITFSGCVTQCDWFGPLPDVLKHQLTLQTPQGRKMRMRKTRMI